jgi:hypothetical protein
MKVTQDASAAMRFKLRWVKSEAAKGLSLKPGIIHTGANSGYQALNLAVQLGVSQIILLGYDMRMKAGKRHFFGDHPGALNKNSNYRLFIERFYTTLADLKSQRVEVLNCTPGSALDCFERRDLADVI